MLFCLYWAKIGPVSIFYWIYGRTLHNLKKLSVDNFIIDVTTYNDDTVVKTLKFFMLWPQLQPRSSCCGRSCNHALQFIVNKTYR
jgi:hypothetical protein